MRPKSIQIRKLCGWFALVMAALIISFGVLLPDLKPPSRVRAVLSAAVAAWWGSRWLRNQSPLGDSERSKETTPKLDSK